MKILIVEDDLEFVKVITGIFNRIFSGVSITVCGSKESAISEIEDKLFDLMVIDLSIPVSDLVQNESPVHGHTVFTTARVAAPGTPVIVLTGSSSEDFIESMLSMSGNNDIWGGGEPLPLVTLHKKHNLDSFPVVLKKYTNEILALREIELLRGSVKLSDAEDRLIRIFTRRVGGVLCDISEINGGLSGAHVFRLIVTDHHGNPVVDSISKIGSINDIKDEGSRYDRYVLRLPPAATPRKYPVLDHGAKDMAGVFYGLADGYTENAFSIRTVSTHATQVVASIEALFENWSVDNQNRKTVSDVRRRLIDDANYVKVVNKFSLDGLDELESSYIQVRWGCVHGDLHGCNVLISNENSPILIDYGDVGDGPSCLDPITLEFSLFFHHDSPLKGMTWPTEQQSLNWSNLDSYLIGCPYPDFIRACREWTMRTAAGERDIAATAYAYFVRQLKYQDVNSSLALSLIEGAKDFYNKT
ncbi:response regulator [Aeromonas hydrophila]|uniref:response regulator n=1 Tax=Aeromonas hydrophila TaxID=644 RepID=UPI002258A6EE|nr:response regulator [Aeromonas hydrophila]MCX4104764.1 response regulator [Aeromonas hydrophila]